MTKRADEIEVVGLCGSLGASSATRRALRVALSGAEDAGARATMIDLREWNLPLGGSDFSPADFPDVERLKQIVRASHGFIWATPEYHGSFSGALKSALDHLTIEDFEGKMVGLLAVAGGSMGAPGALSHLRAVARQLHAWVLPEQVSIASSYAAFHDDGSPRSPDNHKRLLQMGRDVARFARLHAENAAEHAVQQ